MKHRLQKVQRSLRTAGLDGAIITHLPHVRYLSGFSGSNGLVVVTLHKSYFVTDNRYAEQSKQEIKNYSLIIVPKDLFDGIILKDLFQSGSNIGYEENYLSVASFNRIRKRLPGIHLQRMVNIIEQLTVVKEKSEVESIREAIRISDKVFSYILNIIKPGMRESDLAAEIAYRHRLFGAERDGFETIVASGHRGALPHGIATDRKFKKGEFVTFDFGCVVNGYHSDITRTIALGKVTADQEKMYLAVLEAQECAISEVKEGIPVKKIDAIARAVLKKHNFDKYFTHGLGHGIGLHIHENPRVASDSNEILQQGNVITIEPGVYISGVGGIRIEDDILVHPNFGEVLNHSPKSLLIL